MLTSCAIQLWLCSQLSPPAAQWPHGVAAACLPAALQSLMALVASAEAASAAAGPSGLAVNGSAGPSQGQGSTQIGLTPLQPPAADPPVHLWDLLHESVRERILSHLSARELAAAAATCQDFASRVRCMRLSARALTLPTGASLAAVLGMVAGHSNARAISLVRWGARALKETAFAALMTAIAQGSHSRRRSVRVEALSLRGWTKASNGSVLTVLDTMQHLRELDLSDCCSITDAVLGPLSRYTRTATAASRPATRCDDDDDTDMRRAIHESLLAAAGTGTGEGHATNAVGDRSAADERDQFLAIEQNSQQKSPANSQSQASAQLAQLTLSADVELAGGSDAENDVIGGSDAGDSPDEAAGEFEYAAGMLLDEELEAQEARVTAASAPKPSSTSRQLPCVGPQPAPPAITPVHCLAQSQPILAAASHPQQQQAAPLPGSSPTLQPPACSRSGSLGSSLGGIRVMRTRTPQERCGSPTPTLTPTPTLSLSAQGRGSPLVLNNTWPSSVTPPLPSTPPMGPPTPALPTPAPPPSHSILLTPPPSQPRVGPSSHHPQPTTPGSLLPPRSSSTAAPSPSLLGTSPPAAPWGTSPGSSFRPGSWSRTPAFGTFSKGSSPVFGGHTRSNSGHTRPGAAPGGADSSSGWGGVGAEGGAWPGLRSLARGEVEVPWASSLGSSSDGLSPAALGPRQPAVGSGHARGGSQGDQPCPGSWTPSLGSSPTARLTQGPGPPSLPHPLHTSSPGASRGHGWGEPPAPAAPLVASGSAGRPGWQPGVRRAGGVGVGVGGEEEEEGEGAPRGLEVLTLAGCSNLSNDGVKVLMSGPAAKRSLVALDLSRCCRLTRAALVLPPTVCLRVLKAAGCLNLHEVVMQLPLHSPLQELWLNNCKQLTKLVLVAPNLTLLHVGGCKQLGRLELRTPRLTHLLANLCFRLSSLEAEVLAAPRLEYLNLFGCRHLTGADLQVLGQVLVGQALGLKQLNVNGCSALQELELQEHCELKTVDVSGCRALACLSLSSPGLEEVQARACKGLARLLLPSCRRLRLLDVAFCGQLREVGLAALPAARIALEAEQAVSGSNAFRHMLRTELLASAAKRCAAGLALQAIAVPHISGLSAADGCEWLRQDQTLLLQLQVLRAAAKMSRSS
ncbi:hypothetical protein QJQ45_000411 [Haematococcus lacustris]|nr:hypothetical protein QJQ45_000411 [Haematococcus lacustris]